MSMLCGSTVVLHTVTLLAESAVKCT